MQFLTIFDISLYSNKSFTVLVTDVRWYKKFNLLVVGRFINYLHKIAVVVCEPDLQIQRLMENRGMSEAESTALINVQMSLDKKSERADYVLENSGNLQDLKHQVTEIHQKLTKSTLHWKIRLGLGIALGGLMGVLYLVAKQCGNMLNVGKIQALVDPQTSSIPINKKPIFNLILGWEGKLYFYIYVNLAPRGVIIKISTKGALLPLSWIIILCQILTAFRI